MGLWDYDEEGWLTPAGYEAWYARRRAAAARRCALIMAGGHSRRMGADKPGVEVTGRTMLQRAIDFWKGSGTVDHVLVAVGPEEHLADLLPEDVTAVPDLVLDRGPMAGLQAGFRMTQAEVLWVSGVDMPFLTKQALLPEPEGDAVVYRYAGRPEPLFGVYRRSALPTIDTLMNQGNYRMRALLDRLHTQYVEAPPELGEALRNVNTPHELMLARAGTPPLVLVTGWSGTGKTTALEGLLPALIARGVRVCVIKHDAHDFTLDQPGKDTYRFSAAGAQAVAIFNDRKWGVYGGGEADLEDIRGKLPDCDLILGEGFKFSRRPRVEIHRAAAGHPLVSREEDLLAVMTDEPLEVGAPQLGLEDYEGCADLLIKLFQLG